MARHTMPDGLKNDFNYFEFQFKSNICSSFYTKNTPEDVFCRWSLVDSNHRPYECESYALTN